MMVVLQLLLLLMSLRWSPATPPEIPPLFMHRRSIAQFRNFSDYSSCLLLFVPFVATVTISNLAIAVATAFRKSLVALPYTRHARQISAKLRTEQPSETTPLQRQLSKEFILFQRQQQYICKRKQIKCCLRFFLQTDMYRNCGTVVLGIWYLYCVGPNKQRMRTAR